MTAELPRALREEFAAPMKALNDSIHELTTLLKDSHLHQAQDSTALTNLMSRLTGKIAEQRLLSAITGPEKYRFWPKRSLGSTQRPTA